MKAVLYNWSNAGTAKKAGEFSIVDNQVVYQFVDGTIISRKEFIALWDDVYRVNDRVVRLKDAKDYLKNLIHRFRGYTWIVEVV